MTGIFLQKTLILLVLLFVPTISDGIEIISDSIIEGKSIAGLKIGDAEDKIPSALSKRSFKLYYTFTTEANEALMAFTNMIEEDGEEYGLVMDVVSRGGRVVNIGVTSVPRKGKYFYNGKTTKGFFFEILFKLSRNCMESLIGSSTWYIGTKMKALFFRHVAGMLSNPIPSLLWRLALKLPGV